MNETSVSRTLVVRSAGHTCALELAHVIEVMRPLPISTVADAPEMVLGLSIIRGTPVPVVDFGGLFEAGGGTMKRLVLVRAGERRVAFAVEEVLGIYELADPALKAMPPLLQAVAASAIRTIGTLDSELLYVLNTAGIVDEELLAALTGDAL